jgi:hypothetical protein
MEPVAGFSAALCQCLTPGAKPSAVAYLCNGELKQDFAGLRESQQQLELEKVIPQENEPHTWICIKLPLRDAGGVPYAMCGRFTDIAGLNDLRNRAWVQNPGFLKKPGF